jgi:hypothetical protein
MPNKQSLIGQSKHIQVKLFSSKDGDV